MNIIDTVLVVEASEEVRNFLRRALTYKNDQVLVLEASCVAEAHHALQLRTVNCVISNYTLPDGTGLDVLALVQSRNRRIPVIGMSSSDVANVLLLAGAAAFLRKPFTLASLSDTLERVLSLSHQGSVKG